MSGSVPIETRRVGKPPPKYFPYEYVETDDLEAALKLMREGWELYEQVSMRGPGWFDYWTKNRLWRLAPLVKPVVA